MAAPQTNYRFGLFEADPATGRLSREGRPVRLQEQPFQLLITLLRADGGVVTRDELRQRLWREDTFVEFDKSLGVAVAKLRAALGDDAANPRFIETIPRRGYRFIAPLRIVPPAPTPGAAEALPVAMIPAPAIPSSRPPASSGSSPSSSLAPARNRRAVWMAAAILLTATAAGSIWVWRDITRAHLSRREAIVVGAFTNTTGDTVFDSSLRVAAMMGLAQSPYVHVLPDGTLGELLQSLGHPPDEALTPGLGRQLCQQAKADAIVEGSIRSSGLAYVLALQASRCDGTSLARARASVARKDQVIPTLGHEVADLRRQLGEPGVTLESYNAPIEVATTDSLDALRAYQLGMELRARADNLKAIPALKTAIALDPQFAVAFVQLGSSYSNMGNVNEGRPFFRRAFELRDRATAPERFLITGRYFDIVIGDLEKASETYRVWSEVYPDDWMGFNALANDANAIGRYEVAAAASRRAVALEPNRSFGYTNLITALVALKRYDDAKAACRQELERFPDNSSAHLVLYALGVSQGDAAATARELAWSTAHPDRSETLFEEAEWSVFRGRPAEAATMFDEVARRERDAGNAEAPADALVNGAEFEAFMGRTDLATKSADQALEIAHNEVVLGLGALVYALAGRDGLAEQLLQEAAEQHPLSTVTMDVYSPTARAELAGKRRGATLDDVTRALEPSVPYEWGQGAALAPAYVRGLACLRLHAWADAAHAFQAVIDHVGTDPVSPLYPLAYLGLARADARLGRTGDSRNAYATVLEFWKDAEPDFALLTAARQEYAALQ